MLAQLEGVRSGENSRGAAVDSGERAALVGVASKRFDLGAAGSRKAGQRSIGQTLQGSFSAAAVDRIILYYLQKLKVPEGYEKNIDYSNI